MSKWTLFSNHGHVLLYLAGDSQARLRDVARDVGITERAVQKIVRDLQDGGIISVSRHGRRNRYLIHTRKSLRHPLEAHRTVGNLISAMKGDKKAAKRKAAGTARPSARPPPKPRESATEFAAEGAEIAESTSVESAADDKPVEPQRARPEPPLAHEPESAPDPVFEQRPKRSRRKKKPSDESQGSLF